MSFGEVLVITDVGQMTTTMRLYEVHNRGMLLLCLNFSSQSGLISFS